ncbi:hypothetical protein NFI96_011804 [Prochilodus magdalenae]|nr:hypothetical protein NFI96_011804 [Prochilodus magdalenae]
MGSYGGLYCGGPDYTAGRCEEAGTGGLPSLLGSRKQSEEDPGLSGGFTLWINLLKRRPPRVPSAAVRSVRCGVTRPYPHPGTGVEYPIFEGLVSAYLKEADSPLSARTCSLPASLFLQSCLPSYPPALCEEMGVPLFQQKHGHVWDQECEISIANQSSRGCYSLPCCRYGSPAERKACCHWIIQTVCPCFCKRAGFQAAVAVRPEAWAVFRIGASESQLSLANRVRTTWTDLNEPATLYCEEPCSGVETWEKTGVTVAECGRHGGDGFSCERRADGSTLTIPEKRALPGNPSPALVSRKKSRPGNPSLALVPRKKSRPGNPSLALVPRKKSRPGNPSLALIPRKKSRPGNPSLALVPRKKSRPGNPSPALVPRKKSRPGNPSLALVPRKKSRPGNPSLALVPRKKSRPGNPSLALVPRKKSRPGNPSPALVPRKKSRPGNPSPALVPRKKSRPGNPSPALVPRKKSRPAHNSSAEAPAGGLLILDLFTLQPVTVTFSGTDGGSGTPVQMCTVEGRSLQCNPEYRDRVSVFGNSVVLRGVGSADSGVYTVREVYDGAALVRTVSVTVGGRTERSPDSEATREKLQQVTLILTGSKNEAYYAEVECVSNFKFLGVHISEDLTWSLNSSTMVKKAQQRLYFLRSLKKAHLCPRILVDFYRCTIESILTNCISVWYGSCSASDRKALQRVVKTAQRITGTQLPTTESVYQKHCLSRARSIIKDPSHPNHEPFTLLPSGRRYRSLRSRTNRLRKSFFPEAATLLNSTPCLSLSTSGGPSRFCF